MKYKKILVTDDYTTGIYDRCDAAVYVRGDGERMRVERDIVKWIGNTGGYHREKIYLDGKERVKRLMRRLREAQKECLGMGMSKSNNYAVERMLGNL